MQKKVRAFGHIFSRIRKMPQFTIFATKETQNFLNIFNNFFGPGRDDDIFGTHKKFIVILIEKKTKFRKKK